MQINRAMNDLKLWRSNSQDQYKTVQLKKSHTELLKIELRTDILSEGDIT